MTIDDLRELISGLPGDMQVRLAIQPSRPFEHAIARALGFDADGTVAYLTEAGQLGYLPSDVTESLDW
jgi:hypothetical protein